MFEIEMNPIVRFDENTWMEWSPEEIIVVEKHAKRAKTTIKLKLPEGGLEKIQEMITKLLGKQLAAVKPEKRNGNGRDQAILVGDDQPLFEDPLIAQVEAKQKAAIAKMNQSANRNQIQDVEPNL